MEKNKLTRDEVELGIKNKISGYLLYANKSCDPYKVNYYDGAVRGLQEALELLTFED